tara:strand:+ start:56 stop:634 length:579 start_codon:yes stop_codon:yes gene_type:complete
MKNSSISIIRIIFFILFLLCLMVLISQPRAEDNKTVDSPSRTPGGFPKILEDEWPTQILYDTVGACFQGTVKWVVLSNPDLIGQIPGPMAQRQMVEHCFCVMDKIRKELEYQEYIKKVSDMKWTGNLFMTKAAECVGEYQTLPNFFMKIPEIPDNETKNLIPEDKPKDSQDEPPGLKPKESENGLPETIFQG